MSIVLYIGQGAELNPEYTCATTPRTGDIPENIDGLPSNSSPVSEDDHPSRRNNDDDDDINDANEERQDEDVVMFDRSPPPELEDHLRAPLEGLNPNVLGIGGMQNVVIGGHASHMWGEGMKLGAVQHNPHVIDPVLRAQTPGESAVRRLEMLQHRQLQPELAGINPFTPRVKPCVNKCGFESVDETLVCDHSNESYRAVLSRGAEIHDFPLSFELSTLGSERLQ